MPPSRVRSCDDTAPSNSCKVDCRERRCRYFNPRKGVVRRSAITGYVQMMRDLYKGLPTRRDPDTTSEERDGRVYVMDRIVQAEQAYDPATHGPDFVVSTVVDQIYADKNDDARELYNSFAGGRCCLCVGPAGDPATGLCHIHKAYYHSSLDDGKLCNLPHDTFPVGVPGIDTPAAKGRTKSDGQLNPKRHATEGRIWVEGTDNEEDRIDWPTFTADPAQQGYAYYYAHQMKLVRNAFRKWLGYRRDGERPPPIDDTRIDNGEDKWIDLTDAMRRRLQLCMQQLSRRSDAAAAVRAVQKGRFSPNVMALHYPKGGRWAKRQGEPGFRAFMNLWLHKALNMGGINAVADIDAVQCPNTADRRIGKYVRLQPYQVTAKYLLSPESEPGIQRMLFAHGLGTGKTLCMIQVLDNFAFDPRPKIAIFPNAELRDNFYKELCTFGSYYNEWLTAKLGPQAVADAANGHADSLTSVKQALGIPFFSAQNAVATWGESSTVRPDTFIHHAGIVAGDTWILGGPVRAMTYDELASEGAKTYQTTAEKVLFRGKHWLTNGTRRVDHPLQEKIIIMDEAHNMLDSQITQNLVDKKFSSSRADSIRRLAGWLQHRDQARGSVIGFFTATPLINEPDEAAELVDIVKGDPALDGSEGFVSFFIARPPIVFPRHIPEGNMPRMVPVRPTGRALLDTMKMLGASVDMDPVTRTISVEVKAPVATDRLQRRNMVLSEYEDTRGGTLLSSLVTFLRSGADRSANRVQSIRAQATAKCPKLLAVADSILADTEAEIKTLVVMESHGMRTLAMLIRALAHTRPSLARYIDQDAVQIEDRFTYRKQPSVNRVDVIPKIAHIMVGVSGTTGTARSDQLKRGKPVDTTVSNVVRQLYDSGSNSTGSRVRVLIVDAKHYSEGTSFRDVRRIVLATVPPSFSAMMQRVARASRLCRHNFSEAERFLRVDLYVTVIDDQAIIDHLVDLGCKRSQVPNFRALASDGARKRCGHAAARGKKPTKVAFTKEHPRPEASSTAMKRWNREHKKPKLAEFAVDAAVQPRAARVAERKLRFDVAASNWRAQQAEAKSTYDERVADWDDRWKAVVKDFKDAIGDSVTGADEYRQLLPSAAAVGPVQVMGGQPVLNSIIDTPDWSAWCTVRKSQTRFDATLCALHNLAVDRDVLSAASGNVCDDIVRNPAYHPVLQDTLARLGRVSRLIETIGSGTIDMLSKYVDWNVANRDTHFPRDGDPRVLQSAMRGYREAIWMGFIHSVQATYNARVIWGAQLPGRDAAYTTSHLWETDPLFFDSSRGKTPKLYVNRAFWPQVRAAHAEGTVRMLVVSLTIRTTSHGLHANSVVIDLQSERMIQYEPHGGTTGSYDYMALRAELDRVGTHPEWAKLGLTRMRLVPAVDFCPIDGSQFLEPLAVLTETRAKPGAPGVTQTYQRKGICGLHALLFAHLQIANPHLTASEVQQLMVDDPETLQMALFSYLRYMTNHLPSDTQMTLVERTLEDTLTLNLIEPGAHT